MDTSNCRARTTKSTFLNSAVVNKARANMDSENAQEINQVSQSIECLTVVTVPNPEGQAHLAAYDIGKATQHTTPGPRHISCKRRGINANVTQRVLCSFRQLTSELDFTTLSAPPVAAFVASNSMQHSRRLKYSSHAASVSASSSASSSAIDKPALK